MQFIVGKQLDGAVEAAGEGLGGEVGARIGLRANGIQFALVGEAVQVLRPIGQQFSQQVRDAFLSGRRLDLRSIADVTEDH